MSIFIAHYSSDATPLNKHKTEHDQKLIDEFLKKYDVPKWWRGISEFQMKAADKLLNALRDDTEQGTTHRVYNILLSIGISPVIGPNHLKAVMRFSHGNDLAFLFFLYELCYKTPDPDHFTTNEQLILRCITHLDMVPTLRELNRLLPAPQPPKRVLQRRREREEQMKKKIKKHKQYMYFRPQDQVFAPYFQILRPPKPDKIKWTCERASQSVSLGYYEIWKDKNYIVVNEFNRWYAYYKFNPSSRMANNIIQEQLQWLIYSLLFSRKKERTNHQLETNTQFFDAENIDELSIENTFNRELNYIIDYNIGDHPDNIDKVYLCQHHQQLKDMEMQMQWEMRVKARDQMIKYFDTDWRRQKASFDRVMDQLDKDIKEYECRYLKLIQHFRKHVLIHMTTDKDNCIDKLIPDVACDHCDGFLQKKNSPPDGIVKLCKSKEIFNCHDENNNKDDDNKKKICWDGIRLLGGETNTPTKIAKKFQAQKHVIWWDEIEPSLKRSESNIKLETPVWPQGFLENNYANNEIVLQELRNQTNILLHNLNNNDNDYRENVNELLSRWTLQRSDIVELPKILSREKTTDNNNNNKLREFSRLHAGSDKQHPEIVPDTKNTMINDIKLSKIEGNCKLSKTETETSIEKPVNSTRKNQIFVYPENLNTIKSDVKVKKKIDNSMQEVNCNTSAPVAGSKTIFSWDNFISLSDYAQAIRLNQESTQEDWIAETLLEPGSDKLKLKCRQCKEPITVEMGRTSEEDKIIKQSNDNNNKEINVGKEKNNNNCDVVKSRTHVSFFNHTGNESDKNVQIINMKSAQQIKSKCQHAAHCAQIIAQKHQRDLFNQQQKKLKKNNDKLNELRIAKGVMGRQPNIRTAHWLNMTKNKNLFRGKIKRINNVKKSKKKVYKFICDCKCQKKKQNDSLRFFNAATLHTPYKFDYHKIFEFDENLYKVKFKNRGTLNDQISGKEEEVFNVKQVLLNNLLCNDCSTHGVIASNIKEAISQITFNMFKLGIRDGIRKVEDEVRYRNILEEANPLNLKYTASYYDPDDKKLMHQMLEDAINHMRKNARFVLASIVDSHKVPLLREFIYKRFGKVYELEDTQMYYKRSLKIMKSIKRFVLEVPMEDRDKIKKITFFSYNCLALRKKIANFRKRFYHALDISLLTQTRTCWFAIFPHLWLNGPPRNTFFAYLPAHVSQINHTGIWKPTEHRPAKIEWHRRRTLNNQS